MNIKDITPPNLKFIIENYMHPANDRNASVDSMIMTIYMQAARFLSWHRVKFDGAKGWEDPMIYCFNFAKSGAYKDEPADSLIRLIEEPLADQAIMKREDYEARMEKYYREIEGLKGEAKKEYIIENKPKRFKNVFEKGTEVGFQKNRIGAMQAGLGHIHYKSEEFVDDYGKIDSTVDGILTMAKTIHKKGDSASATIGGEWRDGVEGVPLTMLLHSSADRLIDDSGLLKRFLNVLGTGLAKRSFILFDDKLRRVNRTHKQVDEDKELCSSSLVQAKKIFSDMYDSIRITTYMGQKVYKKIDVSPEARQIQNDYKNACNDVAANIKHEIIRAEIYDRFWRAMRLAVCVAVVEHPDNLIVLPEDYVWACKLTDRWGDQFKQFVLQEHHLNIDQLWDLIEKTPKISKTKVRKAITAKSTREVDDTIQQIKMMADERDKMLIETSGRGLARYYEIIDPPEHYDEIDNVYKQNQDPKLIEALIEKYGQEAVDSYLKLNRE